MKVEVKVPRMGESITEAAVGTILKPTGSLVKVDDELLELETDKVNQVLYAAQAGVFTLNVAVDEKVKIGQVIGFIESAPASSVSKELKDSKEAKSVPLSKEREAKEKELRGAESKSAEALKHNKAAPLVQREELPVVQTQGGLVRKTKESFIADIRKTVPGTLPPANHTFAAPFTASAAPSGSAAREDYASPTSKANQAPIPENSMEEHTAILSEISSEIPSAIPARTSGEAPMETRKKMSRIRKVIASRLVEAQKTTAMLTTFNEVDMTQIMALREKYKESFAKKHGAKLGFMSFFVKASLSALQAFPAVNSYIDGDDVVHREYYHIGIAVGTEKGLFVPVVRYCDQLSFAGIESAIEKYALKAREGFLTADDLQGGGFSITNGGIYGSMLSTPIINPPQCAILGMHKITKRAMVVDDQIVIRPMMYLALSYDHRIVDGKEAVSFLVHVKNCLEDPSRLILEL